MTKIEPRLLKGFRDYGPEEQLFRQNTFTKIQAVFERFGFLPMSTPVLEYKDILMGKYGDDEKLVYSFKDNGDRDVAMRYDLTVPFARYVAQNQNTLTFPFKRYQIAPVWRADNPQKGRLREFYQCDIDAVGTDSPLSDAEVIACLAKAIEAVGITNYQVRINDRRNFEVFAENQTQILRSIDKMNKIGIDGVIKELQEKGINQEQIEIAKGFTDGSVSLAYEEVLEQLRAVVIALGVNEKNIAIDATIARGLDYYSSTVFETVLPDQPEFGSICSGGRYDGLVDTYSNQSLSAVGGSIGLDRLFEAMRDMNLVRSVHVIKALVINMDETLQTDYIALVGELRSADINSELYYQTAKLDKQFKYAEAKNIAYAVIMGEDEKNKGVVKVKNIQTRQQTEMARGDLLSFFQTGGHLHPSI
jgi:histidyl-tRNA synthetase